jgi:hypothetical protein
MEMDPFSQIDNLPEPAQTKMDPQVEKAKTRVYPLASIAPFKDFSTNGESEKWDDPWQAVPRRDRNGGKWAPGSVTAVVRLEKDPDNVYILTVGHAFYDTDRNRSESKEVDIKVNREHNTVDFSWGEHNMVLVQAIGPHSKSHGQYYRMGDKLGNTLDAGLALVKADVFWSNIYKHNGIIKNLRTLDVYWPPRNENGVVYCIRELTIPYTEFIECPRFECNFGTWNGEGHSILDCVLLRKRPKGGNDIEHNGTSCTTCPLLNPRPLSAQY